MKRQSWVGKWRTRQFNHLSNIDIIQGEAPCSAGLQNNYPIKFAQGICQLEGMGGMMEGENDICH